MRERTRFVVGGARRRATTLGHRIARLPWRATVLWLTVFVGTLIGAASLLGNRIQAAANDAVFSRDLVIRAERYGGSYYENGIHPKGPLEEVAHDLANRIGGYDGHWYVLSVLVAVACLLLAVAAASTTGALGGGRAAAAAVAAVVYIHFALSDAPYAGLLYSRNIVIALLAGAWSLAVSARPWTSTTRIRLASAAATGAALGFAAQSVLPALVAAGIIGLTASALLRHRAVDRRTRRRTRVVLLASGVGTFALAPLWYAVRGSWTEFTASWWTYARYQQSGIGLGRAEAIGRGWDVAWAYYRDRPLVALLVVAFVAYTALGWPGLTPTARIVHIGLLGWLAAGWLELVAGLRYSSHYFAVIAAPTALIGAALAAPLSAAVRRAPRVRASAVAWPLVAMVLACYLSAGTTGRVRDAAALTGGFTGTAGIARTERDALPDGRRSVRALLDLVSRDGDPLLLYDDNQYLYDVYRRIPATRFPQRYFIVGSIYLGRTGPEYILPGSARWFAEDLRESDPVAFLRTGPVDSPIVAAAVRDRFTEVFTSPEGTVLLREDAAEALIGAAGTSPSVPGPATPGTGWTVSGNRARWAPEATGPGIGTGLRLAGPCTRITGEIAGATAAPPRIRFRFAATDGAADGPALVLDGASTGVERPDGTRSEGISLGSRAPAVRDVAVVTGRRSAALVVGGRVVAATPIPEGASVYAEPLGAGVDLVGLRAGKAPSLGGC